MTTIQWFMTEDHTQRIVGYEWFPKGETLTPMAVGDLYVTMREHPSDVWGPPRLIARDIVLPVARLFVEREGFTVEEEAS